MKGKVLMPGCVQMVKLRLIERLIALFIEIVSILHKLNRLTNFVREICDEVQEFEYPSLLSKNMKKLTMETKDIDTSLALV